jgi:hypothetical protein
MLLFVSTASALVAACGFPRPADVPGMEDDSTCHVDGDCLGSPDKLFCQVSDGTCVGCLGDMNCPTAKALCDSGSHVCRGCISDDECASGVCIEADGACATDAAIVAVSSIGVDVGECTKTAPCASLSFALQRVSAARYVLRVTGSDIPSAAATINIAKDVVIDSNGTRFFAPANSPMFTVATGNVVTIEGISLTGVALQATIAVGASATLRLITDTLDHAIVRATNGAIEAQNLKLAASGIDCVSGTTTVKRSLFDSSTISFSNCLTTVVQNRWDPGFDGAVGGTAISTGGLLTVENNVFVVPSEFADLIQVRSLAPGSVFAYNTIVNTSAVMQSPVAITCDATLNVTSNIIAYNSPNPLTGEGCVAHASLFDLPGAPDAPGNASGNVTTFFKNRQAGDFHLAVGSPALGIGEPGIVTTDFEGNPRPAPAGSQPDVGAYEAP